MDAIIAIATLMSPLLFGTFAFGMLKFVPSLREYQAHKEQDDERHGEINKALARIEAIIRETKVDIIREVKNGHAN